jgi:hypothetical protein
MYWEANICMGSLYELGQQLLIRTLQANGAGTWGRRSEKG